MSMEDESGMMFWGWMLGTEPGKFNSCPARGSALLQDWKHGFLRDPAAFAKTIAGAFFKPQTHLSSCILFAIWRNCGQQTAIENGPGARSFGVLCP
jgi:hypothetical protein